MDKNTSNPQDPYGHNVPYAPYAPYEPSAPPQQYPPQQYPPQSYPPPQYPPQPYAAQPYTAQPYTAQPYTAQPYAAQPYAAQPYTAQQQYQPPQYQPPQQTQQQQIHLPQNNAAVPQYHPYAPPPGPIYVVQPQPQSQPHANAAQQPYYGANAARTFDQMGGIPCKGCRQVYPMSRAKSFKCRNCGLYNAVDGDQCNLS